MAERVLQRNETLVPLPPKVFDTLVGLVENSGRLLEKEELMRRLWPDSFVEDGSLTRKISYLRKALEENDPEQKYIETVPKVGYRFVPEVSAVALDAPMNELPPAVIAVPQEFQPYSNGVANAATSSDMPLVEAPVPTEPMIVHLSVRRMRRVWFFAAIGLAALIGLAVWLYSNSRAYAPFQNRRTVLLTNSGQMHRQTLSPDGKYLAYVAEESARQSLWVQQTATDSAVQITAPGPPYRSLIFSPDGRQGNLFFAVGQCRHRRSAPLESVRRSRARCGQNASQPVSRR